jgi:hypothetical protein
LLALLNVAWTDQQPLTTRWHVPTSLKQAATCRIAATIPIAGLLDKDVFAVCGGSEETASVPKSLDDEMP